MFESLQNTFHNFFSYSYFPFVAIWYGMFVGIYIWVKKDIINGYKLKLNFIGQILNWMFLTLLLALHIVVATVVFFVILNSIVLVISILVYVCKMFLPAYSDVMHMTLTEFIVAVSVPLLVSSIIIGLRVWVFKFLNYNFRRKTDPVRDCQKYLKSGCSHVNGMVCNKTCQYHPEHVKESEDKSIEL